jgi:membrane protease subunit HflK
MAWNLPGKGGPDQGSKDPWKGRDPDSETDAFLERLKQGMGRMFGGEPGEGDTGPRFAMWIGLLLLLWMLFSSFELVNETDRGVVLRFGQFEREMEPGVNLKWPWPVESVRKVSTTNVRLQSGHVRMLTNDQNIVEVDYNVQFTVKDARLYLFGNNDPENTLQQAAESAVREVVGASAMDDVLIGRGGARTARARERLQESLDQYRTGLSVSDFTLKNARPPSEVKEAFDDVSRALQDKDKSINLAQAYASQIVPIARGQAASVRTGAEGYKQATIAAANGDAARYTLLAEQYHKSPEVTRKRLYLETIEDVLQGSSKVLAGRGSNTIYLPAPSHSAGDGAASSPASLAAPVTLPSVTATVPPPSDDSARPDRAPRADAREEPRR